MAKSAAVKRFKFVIDHDSSFEECNGQDRPLTRQEYKDNEYMGCPVHPRLGLDPHPTLAGVGLCRLCRRRAQPIPYSEYLAYYGNPERHVYLGLIQSEQCGHCGEWKETGSLWDIDFMDDDREFAAIEIDHWISQAEGIALPGYAGQLCREGL